MIDSIINTREVANAEAVIVEVGYEKTTSSRTGTENGPKAVVGMLKNQIEFFDRTYKTEVCRKIKIGYEDLGNLSALTSKQAFGKIKEECQKLIGEDKFLVLLGGEHSVSYGILGALAQKYNPNDVTVLQIDAHCDLRDDDGDYSKNPSKFAHSCVMRRVHELGYNLVQVGIRTYHKDEYEYFKKHKKSISVFEWSKNDIPISEILKSIKTKYVYITVDVDGFDPSVMPATGTPVPGGLSWYYGNELIEKVITKYDLIGVDVVEVSPVGDSVLTEYASAQLIYSIIAHKFRDRYK